jgi:small-conductance mechanosensitive channel
MVQDIFDRIYDSIVAYTPKLIWAAIILLAFHLVSKGARTVILKMGRKKAEDVEQVYKLIATTAKVTILIFGVITALGTLGINVTALVAGLGLTGFGLGFALKDAVSNVLAGVLIILYHPFTVSDRIKVSGCEGMVKEINLRYTVLVDGKTDFLIPNSTCFSNWIAVSQEEDA